MREGKDDINQVLSNAFAQLDKNKDDAVSVEELQVLLTKVFGSQFPSSYLDLIMEKGDTNNSGTIDSLEELVDALYSIRSILICTHMIKMLDIDMDGQLTRDELESKLRTSEYEEVKDIIANAPVNDEGGISCEDFFGYCFQRMM